MNISSVSVNTNTTFSPVNEDNVIKALEKQKMQLHEQIQETNASNLDDMTKRERVQQLQEQIQQIDLEIQQIRIEKRNQKSGAKNTEADSQNSSNRTSSNNQTSSNNINNYNDVNKLSGLNDLIKANNTYSNAKIIRKAKNSMLINAQTIKTEFKLDEFTTPYKEKNLQTINAKVRSLDKKFADEIHTNRKQMNKAANDIANDTANDTANDEDQDQDQD